MPDEEIRKFYPPISTGEQDGEGERRVEEQSLGPEQAGETVERKPVDDDVSDLFEVPTDELVDTDDLVTVDIEEDVMDGDLSDLVEVTDEDIMGDELGQTPLESPVSRRSLVRRFRRTSKRYIPPPTSMGGLNV